MQTLAQLMLFERRTERTPLTDAQRARIGRGQRRAWRKKKLADRKTARIDRAENRIQRKHATRVLDVIKSLAPNQEEQRRMIRRILMRRLRAERRGQSVVGLPPRIRTITKSQNG